MRPLSSNRDLYDYLLFLASEFKSRQLQQLSDVVTLASRHAPGMSTEFLGESRIALRRVLNEEKGALTPQERIDISDVLGQLDKALDRRGDTN